MDGRMTKELVISALKDATRHMRTTECRILHSDRGSQYCSLDYQTLAKEHGFISSMSRKGELPGQRPNGELLGEVKAGMAEWTAFSHPRRSQRRSI